METDAAKGGGKTNQPAGIVHILFVIKKNKKNASTDSFNKAPG